MITANMRGALFMMGSMAAFTLNDAFMKVVGAELPLSQAIVLRGIPTTVMLVALAYFAGALRKGVPRQDWRRIAWRSVTEIGAAYFFITAIFNMDFANALAILQVLPLTITLAGAVFLKEPVGWRRWGAILLGFVGVLMIVRPGFAGFTVYSLYVLAAVACVTARDILSRGLSKDVPSLTVALMNAISVTAAFAVYAFFEDWVPVQTDIALNLGAASVFIIAAYFCAVAAVRVGDLAVVAPFRYTALIWAMLLGVLAFGETLDGMTLAGAALIVATGMFSFYREQQLAKAQTTV